VVNARSTPHRRATQQRAPPPRLLYRAPLPFSPSASARRELQVAKIGKVERPRFEPLFLPTSPVLTLWIQARALPGWIYLGSNTFSHLLSSLYRRSAIHEYISHWPEILPPPISMANLANTLDLQMLQPRPRDQNPPLSPPAKLGEVSEFRVSRQNGWGNGEASA
jgi:hypothetical protein